ncbi:aminoacyl-tRNA hydrolase [soil metagenome]
MKVVVGLRNPGSDYELTRHNVGHEVLMSVAREHGSRMGKGPRRSRCECCEVTIGDQRVLLAAPLTFMNDSGGPVRAVVDYFSAGLDELLVLHDDIDLPFGRLRLQRGGGTGGHNGLRSIERSMGTRDFHRLKIGVGRPPGRMDPSDFVLRRFTKAERTEMDLVVGDANGVVEAWVSDVETATRLAGERRL